MREISKMKYRDMLGFPKKKAKKKIIPEQPKPSVADKLKEELNEWNDTTFKNLPKDGVNHLIVNLQNLKNKVEKIM